jgi:hypothetical protein
MCLGTTTTTTTNVGLLLDHNNDSVNVNVDVVEGLARAVRTSRQFVVVVVKA